MYTKHIGSIITAALLCQLAPFCMAQEARELTSSCVITSPNKKTDSVHDGEYTSFWRSRTGENSAGNPPRKKPTCFCWLRTRTMN